MNSIESRIRIDFYNDLTRSARFTSTEYAIAVNNAMQQFIDDKMGDESQRMPENFQWVQSIRDDLYNLIKTVSPTVTNGAILSNEYFSYLPSHINFPTDYYTFISLFVLIDGYTKYSKPTSYNLAGPQFEDSFSHPTNKRTYYNEDSTGLVIYRGITGNITTATLNYIRQPAAFSIGQEYNIIQPGIAVLTNGVVYIATEDSVQSTSLYPAGTQFTAVGGNLTSGAVILASNTQQIDLPDRVQDDICKMASVILLSNISLFDNSQAVKSQISKD